MGLRQLRRVLTVSALVLLSAIAHAQEATLSGTVIDESGGLLPGVVVRAVNEATGNNFEAVTDGSGAYRLPIRVGTYRITAELADSPLPLRPLHCWSANKLWRI
jgi:hypothetical protein